MTDGTFHDPFAGGGSLPLEAQRLGLEAHASDLNPVAVLINKAMIEIRMLGDWLVVNQVLPVAAQAGYFAAFFLRSAQEAVIRSETAFFSSAVIGRRFLVGLASDAVSATGVAAAAGRREEERRAAGFAGAEVTSILSTSFNALISACRRSISL